MLPRISKITIFGSELAKETPYLSSTGLQYDKEIFQIWASGKVNALNNTLIAIRIKPMDES